MRILLFFLLLITVRANASGPLSLGRIEPAVPENTPPEITCPADVTVSTEPFSCVAPFDYSVVVTDDQAGWTLTQTAGLPPLAGFPVGTTVNQFSVTDTENFTVTCSFTVVVHDYNPPVAVCLDHFVAYIPVSDDPGDCYDGAVSTLQASVFDGGSVDNCGLPLLITVQRMNPYSDGILQLNPVNGHPDCNEAFPDFPSEFERSISENTTLKVYCFEAGTTQALLVRTYQTNADGSIATGAGGTPIYNQCYTLLEVEGGVCPDSTTSLAGVVRLDLDGDCLVDPGAAGVSDLVIQATAANGTTVYTSTGSAGTYTLQNLEPGLQEITTLPLWPSWSFCNLPASVTIPSTPGLTTLYDLYAQPVTNCPMLQVNLTTTLVRPCKISSWTGKYCNLGGETAENAYVDLLVPSGFSWVSASGDYVIIDDTLRLQLGTVEPGACGNFQASIQVPCLAEIIGQNLCVEAHIYPDDICLPPSSGWSGAQIQVSAECEGDSVRFTLRNTGLVATTQPLDYVIIDDMVIMLEKTLPAHLPAGASIVETVAANGDAYRLNAQQEAGHPTIFNPSVSVESCNGLTTNSLIQEFANEDGSFFTDFACREVVGSLDPNEKTAFPKGYSPEHLIEANTFLNYQIGFQNTGNDTAFLVVLHDTLSPLLDPASLRITNSSHPFTWKLDNNGHLEVQFRDVLLPDSTTNEPASHGFIQYAIAQKPDNPAGSLIENRAGIYFDVNPVVLTNMVWHTVGHDFVLTATRDPKSSQPLLSVYPNPATETAFVSLEQKQAVQIRLLNVLGKEVQRYPGKAPGIQLQRAGLPEGMYWIEVAQEGSWSACGKLIWKN